MHGLQTIRNINAAHRERVKHEPAGPDSDQSEDRKLPRFQRQSRNINGVTHWSVYDSRNAGWGFASVDVIEVDREVERLNTGGDPLARNERQDVTNAALAAKASRAVGAT